MTKNSTATSKWGSTTIEQITPVHYTISKDGYRTASVLMPDGARLSDEEHDKLTEVGLGLQGFRGIRFSLKHERFFIDFTPKFTDSQITSLVTGMLHEMCTFVGETPAMPQRTTQKNSTLTVQFSSS